MGTVQLLRLAPQRRLPVGLSSVVADALLPRLATLGPLLALLLLTAVFSSLSPVFLTWRNITQLLQQVMEVGTLAVGQTIIVLTAGIDLANGAIMVFGTIVMANLVVSHHWPVLAAVIVGIGATTFLSFVSGVVIAMLSLPAFIVTLGMLNVMYASTLLYSGGTEIQGLPPAMLRLGEAFAVGRYRIPYGPLVMLTVFLVGWYLVGETAWGRHLKAIGSSQQTARVAGIRVKSHLMSVYALAGFVYGVASMLVIARTAIADPLAGQTDNLDSIAAVVIGGTSFFGGRRLGYGHACRRANRWGNSERAHDRRRGRSLSIHRNRHHRRRRRRC
jgi:fructose transport system permease protein